MYVTDTEFRRWKRCVSCTTTSTSDTDFSYEVPDGKLLDNIVVLSDTNQTLDIGTTPAGTEIVGAESVTGGTPLVISTAEYEKTIYITGVSGLLTVKFYLR